MLNQKRSSLTIIFLAFILTLLITLKSSNVDMMRADPRLHVDQHRLIEENRSIRPDVPYEDSIQPNSIKQYTVKMPEKAILIIGLKATCKNNSSIKLSINDHGGNITVAFPPFPKNERGLLYYSTKGGEVTITIKNQNVKPINYKFYIDISERIESRNSKNIPLSNYPVGFHIDLGRDDQLSISLPQDGKIPPKIIVYVLYKFRDGFLLREYASSEEGKIRIKADLKDRYYIIVWPRMNERMVQLKASVESPIWNNPNFWPLFSLALSIASTAWFGLKINSLRDLRREGKFTLLSNYLSILTLSAFISVMGTYNIRAPTLKPLFSITTILYALSLATHIYAAYMRRRAPIICPHCLRRINPKETAFCCGERLKGTSSIVYLMPLAIGLMPFLIVYNIPFDNVSQQIRISAYAGIAGCIAGGVLSWHINRDVIKRAWVHVIVGVITALTFPWLIYFILAVSEVLMPVFHTEIYREYGVAFTLIRINAASPLPPGTVAAFVILAAYIIYVIYRQNRIATAYSRN